MKHEKAGTETPKLYYDTYALYAIAIGDSDYRPFAKDHQIVTSLMNLYELYHSLLRDGREALAEAYFERLAPCCVDITTEAIRKASRLRIKESKRKLSYIDCLGYVLAQDNAVMFLTGDQGFQELTDVVFVKSNA